MAKEKGKPKRKYTKRPKALVLREPEVIPPGQGQNKVGRPSEYSGAIGNTICERMVNGESLRSVCRDESMPCLMTVFRWKVAHPEFREQYDAAREIQAEILAEEIIEIADTTKIGVRRKFTPLGLEVTEGDMVARSRLMVDARKWAASRLLWKRYGNRPQEEPGSKLNEQLEALASALNSGPVAPGEVNE